MYLKFCSTNQKKRLIKKKSRKFPKKSKINKILKICENSCTLIFFKNMKSSFLKNYVEIKFFSTSELGNSIKSINCYFLNKNESGCLAQSMIAKFLTLFYFQCQSAALDELFGNPAECFQRYHTAQILLHSLSQQVNHSQDKALLIKCE